MALTDLMDDEEKRRQRGLMMRRLFVRVQNEAAKRDDPSDPLVPVFAPLLGTSRNIVGRYKRAGQSDEEAAAEMVQRLLENHPDLEDDVDLNWP